MTTAESHNGWNCREQVNMRCTAPADTQCTSVSRWCWHTALHLGLREREWQKWGQTYLLSRKSGRQQHDSITWAWQRSCTHETSTMWLSKEDLNNDTKQMVSWIKQSAWQSGWEILYKVPLLAEELQAINGCWKRGNPFSLKSSQIHYWAGQF